MGCRQKQKERLAKIFSLRISERFYNRLEEIRKNSNSQYIGEVARRILYRKEIIWYHKDGSMGSTIAELALIRKELNAIGINHQYRENLFFIGRTIGSWFNPKNLPLTADLMAHVWQDASYFIWSAKYKYLRIRPYKIDTDINNLEETEWAAYPSGRAANSYINAYLYQELAPEFADTFIKDAYDMAHSREIIWRQYPSDSETSRILAPQFVNKLFQTEKFLREFEQVKGEWSHKARESFAKPDLHGMDLKNGKSGGEKATSCVKKCD